MKQKDRIKGMARVLYHVGLGCLLITINIYFFIFVHNIYDLSPNFALGIITIPIAIYEIYKGVKYNKVDEHEKAK